MVCYAILGQYMFLPTAPAKQSCVNRWQFVSSIIIRLCSAQSKYKKPPQNQYCPQNEKCPQNGECPKILYILYIYRQMNIHIHKQVAKTQQGSRLERSNHVKTLDGSKATMSRRHMGAERPSQDSRWEWSNHVKMVYGSGATMSRWQMGVERPRQDGRWERSDHVKTVDGSGATT